MFPVHGDYTSETKPFYLTSEFLVYALYMIGLGIAAATDATIDSRFFWIFATVATAAYVFRGSPRRQRGAAPATHAKTSTPVGTDAASARSLLVPSEGTIADPPYARYESTTSVRNDAEVRVVLVVAHSRGQRSR
jgi:hypothetical protein